MFEKTTKTVKEVGGSVLDSAKNLGVSIYSTSKEQTELAGMKVQRSNLKKKLQESYAEIGKRYVEFTANAAFEEAFDVSDLLEAMKPDLEKLEEIEAGIAEKEMNAKRAEDEKWQKKAQDEFDAEKAKLEKAIEMDIISQEEYDEKLEKAQKKLDHYDQYRKYNLQLQMGIITKTEYSEKINALLK